MINVKVCPFWMESMVPPWTVLNENWGELGVLFVFDWLKCKNSTIYDNSLPRRESHANMGEVLVVDEDGVKLKLDASQA